MSLIHQYYFWHKDCKYYVLREARITHLPRYPMLSSFPVLVYHSPDILCRCPLQQRASPPTDRNMSTQTTVPARAAQVLWDETNTGHGPVPWHSAWWRQSTWLRESGSSWLDGSSVRDWFSCRRSKIRTNACERKNRATYSDFVIVALVLHVLIKLFLRVKLDPAHLQLLPYLQHNTKAWKQAFMWHSIIVICVF